MILDIFKQVVEFAYLTILLIIAGWILYAFYKSYLDSKKKKEVVKESKQIDIWEDRQN